MATDPTTIPSIADLQKTKNYMEDINDFISSGNDTLTDADGVNRKTLTGIENDADTVITNIQSDADSTLAEKSDEFDQTLDQYKESRGFRNKGTFTAGFTYEQPNDVGFDTSGKAWALTDINSLPYTVTAGTTPSEPTFYQSSYNTAAQVSTNTSDTVQSFVDSFALKIFQSPTDGGLTEIQTRTVESGEVYEVRKTSDDSLATIYSDATGTTEIVQNGTDNKSGSDGVVEFYIADGDYRIASEVEASNFRVGIEVSAINFRSHKIKYITSDEYQSTLDVQQYLSNEMTDATRVIISGTFTATKATGFGEDIYGTDGRSLGGLILSSGQPCLFIPKSRKNIIFDASSATFIVDKHGQGGLDVWGSRNKILHGGHWIAPANAEALVRFPPIDGNSGFAEKGTSTYGFNTTTLSPDIGGVRNNQVDTSGQNSGGYGGAFPTDTGGTAATWGTWLGGFIGNYGSGITICGGFGHTVHDFEVEGFNGYGIEVGMIRLPDGTALNRIDPLADPVTPKKTKILGGYVHDCYTGGVQRNRYIKCDIMHLNVEKVGHPDASLANTINGSSPQIDPGYGVSSGRFSPQFKSTVAYCNFEDCNRKGIDAHMGTGEKYIANDVKAMNWGVQIAVDEALQDTARGNGFYDRKYNLVLRDNTVYAGYRAIDAANGAFGRDPRETADLWWNNFHALIDGNACFAPNGWYYNYGHSPFTITNNTFTYSAPYGYANTGVGFGFTHGAFASRGPVDGDVIKNNKVFNGPDGNYNYSYYLYQLSNATIRDNLADITPYTHDTANPNEPYKADKSDMHRNGLASIGFVASGNQITDSVTTNNKSINQLTGTVLTWSPVPAVVEAAQSVEYSMQFHGAGTIADTGKNKSDTGAENSYIVRQDNQLPDSVTTFGKEAGGGFWTGLVVNEQWLMGQVSMNDTGPDLSTIEMWIKVSETHSSGSTYAFRAGAPYDDESSEIGVLVLSNSGAGFILNNSGGGTRYIDGQPYVAGTTLNLDTWYKIAIVRSFKCSWLAFGASNSGNQGMSGKLGRVQIIKKYSMSDTEALASFNADKALYGK